MRKTQPAETRVLRHSARVQPQGAGKSASEMGAPGLVLVEVAVWPQIMASLLGAARVARPVDALGVVDRVAARAVLPRCAVRAVVLAKGRHGMLGLFAFEQLQGLPPPRQARHEQQRVCRRWSLWPDPQPGQARAQEEEASGPNHTIFLPMHSQPSGRLARLAGNTGNGWAPGGRGGLWESAAVAPAWRLVSRFPRQNPRALGASPPQAHLTPARLAATSVTSTARLILGCGSADRLRRCGLFSLIITVSSQRIRFVPKKMFSTPVSTASGVLWYQYLHINTCFHR
jgi:hypothetical protein